MAQEINESVSYLRALKHSGTETASAAAPTRETGPEGQASLDVSANYGSSDPVPGAEKRRSTRHKCEGSAELREVGCDVHTWVSFTDISLHGCYVEAQASYPVGTALNLKLDANGFRVEAAGTVSVSYPYLGMGIVFADMSEENQARLRDLVGSLARHSMIMGPGIASALPSHGTLQAVPLISDSAAGVQALLHFFEDHQMLTREDFLRILRTSQSSPTR